MPGSISTPATTRDRLLATSGLAQDQAPRSHFNMCFPASLPIPSVLGPSPPETDFEMGIRLPVIYWGVSLRGCEGSRPGQKLKFTCNVTATEASAKAIESSGAGVDFINVPCWDKRTWSLPTTLSSRWTWAAPGEGTQPWVRQLPSDEGHVWRGTKWSVISSNTSCSWRNESRCPQGVSRQFTVTFHHTPKFTKLGKFMKPSAKPFGLHSQATCLTLEQGEVCSQTLLTNFGHHPHGYDSHRRTWSSWEGEGHRGVCFTFTFPCQSHLSMKMMLYYWFSTSNHHVNQSSQIFTKNLQWMQCILWLCSFAQLLI